MENYIVAIGAANIDIYGKTYQKIRSAYDHPSEIYTSAGGVSRNILENTSRLGIESILLTAIGDDYFGEELLKQSNKAGINTKHILKVKNGKTAIFMQVQNSNNDMHLAICDFNINKNIDIKYLTKKDKIIRNAKSLIIDPSLEKDILDYLFTKYADKKIFVDPISDNLSKKLKPYLNNIYCLKPNLSELSVLTNTKIKNDDDLYKASHKLINKGVKHLFVSLSKDGILYVDKDICKKVKFKETKNIQNASGAGDACMAAIVYSDFNNLNINDTIDMALASGIAAISSKDVINKKMSKSLLKRIIKENKE